MQNITQIFIITNARELWYTIEKLYQGTLFITKLTDVLNFNLWTSVWYLKEIPMTLRKKGTKQLLFGETKRLYHLKKKGPNFRCITSDAKLVALFLQLVSDSLKCIAMRCFISSLILLRIAIVFLQTSYKLVIKFFKCS